MDGSAPSRAALRWAVGQARLIGGTVEAVIAWQLPMMLMNHGWAPIHLEEEADFAGALLGLVSQHCVQHARCPVLIVR